MAAVDSNSTVNCIAAQLSPTPDNHYNVHLELATKNEATRSLGVVYMDIVIGDIIYPRTRFFVVPDLRDDGKTGTDHRSDTSSRSATLFLHGPRGSFRVSWG
jgi:hypothetical protein